MSKRAIVLGGAGFLGSHLVERLLGLGYQVVAVDNFSTGRRENLQHLHHASLQVLEHDVCQPIPVVGPASLVLNLASPASPFDYARWPLETLDVGSLGTRCGLDLARRSGATFMQASTSEVYGDPVQHPQTESYFGNVNPVGPRACYDESKRFAEALVTSYARVHGTPVRIARIFNTYGPRMRANDGRVIPAFVNQALANEDFTVFGDGSQTRSFCYVDDLIDGFLALIERGDGMPVNLGNPREMTLRELAEVVRKVAGSGGQVRSTRPLPQDDPRQRRPDISRAKALLGWEPRVSLEEGLGPTIAWARAERGASPRS